MKLNDPEFKKITRMKRKMYTLFSKGWELNYPNDGDVSFKTKEFINNLFKEFDIKEKL